MEKIDFRSLANHGVRNLTPYQPGKPIEEVERELGITAAIKLASNENPLGASPKAIHIAQQALQKSHYYPDGGCYEIKKALAQFLSVKTDQITVGNGSENILELIVKAYLHKDDTAIISQYAFLTIPILIQSYGAYAKVAKAYEWGHDVHAMIKAIDSKTRVLFLVNPNNPTGTYTSTDDFLTLLQAVPPHVLIVVDEAYSEYISQSDYPETLHYLNAYPNLIVTRTFSKIYGLAALRLGYSVSSPEIADILNRSRLPFNVNTIAAKAACAALNDQEHVQKSIQSAREGMQQLKTGIQALGLAFIPSLGNFITVDVQDSMQIYQKLLQQGVIVRPLNAYNMPRHIRVSIGTKEQNEKFLTAIETVMRINQCAKKFPI